MNKASQKLTKRETGIPGFQHDRREQSERESDSVRHDRDVRRARGEISQSDHDEPPPGGPGRGDES